jgi:hypothetical protein
MREVLRFARGLHAQNEMNINKIHLKKTLLFMAQK